MKVKYEKIHPCAITPQQATNGSVGFDLFAIEDTTILPGETKIVKTGIRVELPEGHFMYVSSKGGPAGKAGVFVLNSPGLVDQDYRGELLVILHKTLVHKSFIYGSNIDGTGSKLTGIKEDCYIIHKGQKIAQFVILPYPAIELEEGVVNVETERSEGRLGSTGLLHKEKGVIDENSTNLAGSLV